MFTGSFNTMTFCISRLGYLYRRNLSGSFCTAEIRSGIPFNFLSSKLLNMTMGRAWIHPTRLHLLGSISSACLAISKRSAVMGCCHPYENHSSFCRGFYSVNIIRCCQLAAVDIRPCTDKPPICLTTASASAENFNFRAVAFWKYPQQNFATRSWLNKLLIWLYWLASGFQQLLFQLLWLAHRNRKTDPVKHCGIIYSDKH